MLQHIYLIKSKGDNYYKIGRSSNVALRLNKLQKESPFNLEIAFSSEVENAVEVEAELHLMFSSKNTKGEWFKLSEEDQKVIEYHIANINHKNALERQMRQEQTPYKHTHIKKADIMQHKHKFDFNEPVIVTNRNMPEYIITKLDESSVGKAMNMMQDLGVNMSNAMLSSSTPNALRISGTNTYDNEAIKEFEKYVKELKEGGGHEKHSHK